MAIKEPQPLQTQIGLKLVEGPTTPDKLNEKPGDVIQGAIAGCPIAAIMIAMAHARHGALGKILGAPQKGPVDSTWRGDTFQSAFFYNVTFPGQQAVQITPQLYTDDGTVHYAQTPQGGGWPSYIEKAYAVFKSGTSSPTYESINLKQSLADVARDLMTRITELDLTVEQDVDVKAARVIKLAKASKKKPTAAASRQQGNNALQIVAAHGYAIVGYRKGVLIQNPHDASIRTIDPKVFHLGFDTIVQAQ